LKNNLNKYKFEENFLSRLSIMFSKYFNKKIEFSIIKISNIKYNTDMFTYNLGIRYRRRKFNIISVLGRTFGGISFPNEEEIDRNPKLKMKEFVDLSLLKNKFKDLHLIHVLNVKELFDVKLYEIYGFLNSKLLDKIDKTLDYIKYKKLRGLKVMANGRLTMRYRADRAQHKFIIEGGLRNIDSSFKGLKSGMYRGNIKVNTEYSLYESKRRIGTYAVKG
jgi:Mitochondrial ribosomal protein (VAR1)